MRRLGLLAFAPAVAVGQAPAPQEPALAVVSARCLDCHSGETAWAGVRLDEIPLHEASRAEQELLARVRDAVLAGTMPPAEREPLSEEERGTLLGWLDEAIEAPGAAAAQADGIDPGWFAIRRLSSVEYTHTLGDLLGIDPRRLEIDRLLPPDDLGDGFDNSGSALSVSDVHLEAYLDIASRAVELALGPPIEISSEYRRGHPFSIDGGGRVRGGQALMYSNGTASVPLRAEAGGSYRARVRAWGTRGGDELPRVELSVNGRSLRTDPVLATDSSNPDEFTVEFTLPPGDHTFGASFTNDYYVKDEADRNLTIAAIDLAGPLSVSPDARPPLHRTLFGDASPLSPADEREAASRIVGEFAAQAYRQPLDERDLQRLLGLYERARLRGLGFERSVRDCLVAALVAPRFLMLMPDDGSRDAGSIGEFALASRLSYALWNSTPDGELRRLAQHGFLSEPEVLRSQIGRLLGDPRSDRFVESFVGQWLLLRNLERITFDTDRFPEMDDELRTLMVREVFELFGDAVRRNLPPRVLLDSRVAFLNDRLAHHYGIEGVEGDWLRPVSLSEGSGRGGVLTTAAVLSLTSNPTQSSPVKRGLFVLDQLLGTPPPPPPPDIPPLEAAAKSAGDAPTARELLAIHAADPTCYSCHSRMDPIGLALENFDPIGRWRDEMYGEAIDASGELPSGESFTGPGELRQLLLAREEQFVRHLASRLLTYFIGRGLEPYDRASLDQIIDRFEASRDRGLADLIEAVATSPPVLRHRPRQNEITAKGTP